jgi:hypothetical protein
VFITGEMDGSADLDLVQRTGARYLLKPFSVDDYVRTVQEAIRDARNPS